MLFKDDGENTYHALDRYKKNMLAGSNLKGHQKLFCHAKVRLPHNNKFSLLRFCRWCIIGKKSQ